MASEWQAEDVIAAPLRATTLFGSHSFGLLGTEASNYFPSSDL